MLRSLLLPHDRQSTNSPPITSSSTDNIKNKKFSIFIYMFNAFVVCCHHSPSSISDLNTKQSEAKTNLLIKVDHFLNKCADLHFLVDQSGRLQIHWKFPVVLLGGLFSSQLVDGCGNR